MQEITKKNLNSEKLWNFRAWENSGDGDKEMSLPLFLYLKKEEQDNTEILLILICYGEKKGVEDFLMKLFKSIC